MLFRSLHGKYKVPHFDGKGEVDAVFATEAAPTSYLLAAFYWENYIYFGQGPRRNADGVLQLSLPLGGQKLPGVAAEDIGVIIGSGMGGLTTLSENIHTLTEKGPGRVSPFMVPAMITNMAAGQVSMMHGFKGPNFCPTSACATAAHAIGEAAEMIRRGVASIMVAGGSEATVCEIGVLGFSQARALSTAFNDNPTAASRPWDKDRDGFVMGEGCGALVLEELEHAKKRGAKIYAEVSGYGMSGDAYHITSPAEGHDGA